MKQKENHRMKKKLSLKIIGFVVFYTLFIPALGLSGVIKPRRSSLFIGESLRVVCSVPDSADYLKLRFKLETKHDQWYLPSKRSTFDNSSVETNIFINENFLHITNVSCLYGEDLLDSTTIYAEKPLKNISDFGGYFLRARWSYSQIEWSLDPDYYLNIDHIDTRVSYSFKCSQDWSSATACDVAVSGNRQTCVVKFNGMFCIVFKFTISLKETTMRPGPEYLQPLFETEIEDRKEFRLLENIKTGPVKDVTVNETTAKCTRVSWTQPYFFKVMCREDLCRNVTYQLTFTPDNDDKVTVFEGSVHNSKTIKPLLTCGLVPFTRYSLEVRVRKNASHPWSDPSETVRLTTKEDKPLTGPKVSATNYHIVKQCQDGMRNICVYWNAQSLSSVRGHVTAFEIEIPSMNVSKKERKSSNFWCSSDLPCNRSIDVEIYTVTKSGRSLNASVIYIPSQTEENKLPKPSQLDFLAQELYTDGLRHFSILWNTEAVASNSVFDDSDFVVVYMCEESSSNKCYDDYQRKEIKAGAHKVVLENVDRNIDLLGYALQSHAGTYKTGIYWSDCIYQDHLLPNPPTQLSAYEGSEPATLKVEWIAKRCDRHTKVLVKKYHLLLCTPRDIVPAEPWENSTCKKVSIPSQKGGHYTFSDLEETTYQVYLWAESSKGLSSRVSAIGTIRQRRKGELSIAVVILATITLIILVAVILCCIMYHRENKKRRKDVQRCQQLIDPDVEEPRPVTNNSGLSNKAFERVISHDSGVDVSPVESQPSSPVREIQEISDFSLVDCTHKKHFSTINTQGCNVGDGQVTVCGKTRGSQVKIDVVTPSDLTSKDYLPKQMIQNFRGNVNHVSSNYLKVNEIEGFEPVIQLESDSQTFVASKSDQHGISLTDGSRSDLPTSYPIEDQKLYDLPKDDFAPHMPQSLSSTEKSGSYVGMNAILEAIQDRENKSDAVKSPASTCDNKTTEGDDEDLNKNMKLDPFSYISVNEIERTQTSQGTEGSVNTGSLPYCPPSLCAMQDQEPGAYLRKEDFWT